MIITSATREARGNYLVPFALALLILGVGILAIVLYSVAAPSPLYARTRGTALLALGLATPALGAYAFKAGRAELGAWWLQFWTFAFIAYLMHFWFGFVVTFDADPGAVGARQSYLVAVSNFTTTGLWMIDVIVAQFGLAGLVVGTMRLITHVIVLVSFVLSTVVFRSGATRLVGMLALAIVVVTLVARVIDSWHHGHRNVDRSAAEVPG